MNDAKALCRNHMPYAFPSFEKNDFSQKRVLLRLDLNMPMDGTHITVRDDTRLQEALPTLQQLKKMNAHTLIVTHIGRPQAYDTSLSTRHLIPTLEHALGMPVQHAQDLSEAQLMVQKQGAASNASPSFTLLENIRFYPEEMKNDATFAQTLAHMCDVYINDAFSSCHRCHASTYGVPAYMHQLDKPVYAGYHLIKEMRALNTLFQMRESNDPARFHPPIFAAFLGGAKISNKLPILEKLLDMSKWVILGGGIAHTFLVAIKRLQPGASLYEKDMLDTAKRLYDRFKENIILPLDAVVTSSLHTKPAAFHHACIEEVRINDMIVDLGPKTMRYIDEHLRQVQAASDGQPLNSDGPPLNIVWNGPFGVIETPPFDQGSQYVAKTITEATARGAVSIVGGGDTLACLGPYKTQFTHVSTAGGAFLEYIEKGYLPGVDILVSHG